MPIIISSRDIYNQDTSPILRNNIKSVEVPVKVTTVSHGNDSKVYSATVENTPFGTEDSGTQIAFDRNANTNSYVAIGLGYVDCKYFRVEETEIPIREGNDIITDFYLNGGRKHNGITVTIIGSKIKGTCRQAARRYKNDTWEVMGDVEFDPSTVEVENGELTPPYEVSHSYSYTNNNEYPPASASISLKLGVDETSQTIEFSYEDLNGDGAIDTIVIKPFFIYAGASYIYKLRTYGSGQIVGKDYIDYSLSGTYEGYRAKRLEFSIDGEVSKLIFDDETYTYGEGGNPWKIDGNELIQRDGTDSSMPSVSRVFMEYSNGKQTATLTCDVSQYYDEGGDIPQVNSNGGKMLFELFDEVIPFVHTADGDKPMAYYTDDTPKVFEVTGVKIKYDGACWQELSLLEK